MAKAFNRLERVIELETKQGFQDKAVVGGIRQFAAYWVGEAREEAADEAELALVEQIAELLMSYSRLPGPEVRAEAIGTLRDKLRDRKERLQEATPDTTETAAQPPPQQPQPAQPKPAQESGGESGLQGVVS